jgi:hypothetical protein
MSRGLRRPALIAGIVLMVALTIGSLALPLGNAHVSPAASLKTGSTHVAAPSPQAANVSVVYSTTLLRYTQLPVTAHFNVTVSGATISPTNLSVYVLVEDVSAKVFCSSWSLNSSVPGSGTTAPFSYVINASNLAPALANAKCNLLADTAGFVAVANVTATNQSSAEITAFLLGLEPTTSGFLSPSGTTFGTGNITFVAYASGQFISGVTLDIVTGGTIVFHQVLLASANYTNQFIPVVWTAAAAGTYTASLVLANNYGAPVYNNISLTITSPGSTTITTRSWNNSTLIPGISGPIAGTLLLVVGMIVGMIAALAVGRWMMAPKQAPAPQAWSGTQPGAKAPNTCPTCGASFPTAEELAAHSKSEHGMG